jgi:hypothetical protein
MYKCNLAEHVIALQRIPISAVMSTLYDNWQHFIWGDMHSIPSTANRIPVRDITDSRGFKKRTYQYWFSDDVIAKCCSLLHTLLRVWRTHSEMHASPLAREAGECYSSDVVTLALHILTLVYWCTATGTVGGWKL